MKAKYEDGCGPSKRIGSRGAGNREGATGLPTLHPWADSALWLLWSHHKMQNLWENDSFKKLNQQLSDKVWTEIVYYKLYKSSVYSGLTVLDCIRLYSSSCYYVQLLFCVAFGNNNVHQSIQNGVKFTEM